jgi:hypothetical protein
MKLSTLVRLKKYQESDYIYFWTGSKADPASSIVQSTRASRTVQEGQAHSTWVNGNI